MQKLRQKILFLAHQKKLQRLCYERQVFKIISNHIDIDTHTHSHALTHTHPRTRTHSHSLTRTHSHTLTHTHTRTHKESERERGLTNYFDNGQQLKLDCEKLKLATRSIGGWNFLSSQQKSLQRQARHLWLQNLSLAGFRAHFRKNWNTICPIFVILIS